AVDRPCQRSLEDGHLVATADEPREAAGPGDVKPRAHAPDAIERIDAKRLRDALQAKSAETREREESLHECGGVLAQVRLAWIGEGLEASGDAHHLALRRVVHAQVVADRADHHLAGIETHAGGERQAALALELLCEASELLAEMEGGVAGTMGVILVCQWCSEERHHA